MIDGDGHSRHCERSEAIQTAGKRLDCFVAEFIIGPAKGRTRWLLAMTAVKRGNYNGVA
jgi:hypothetical protein